MIVVCYTIYRSVWVRKREREQGLANDAAPLSFIAPYEAEDHETRCKRQCRNGGSVNGQLDVIAVIHCASYLSYKYCLCIRSIAVL